MRVFQFKIRFLFSNIILISDRARIQANAITKKFRGFFFNRKEYHRSKGKRLNDTVMQLYLCIFVLFCSRFAVLRLCKSLLFMRPRVLMEGRKCPARLQESPQKKSCLTFKKKCNPYYPVISKYFHAHKCFKKNT